jgi:rRNA maturation protein Nop10
LDTGQVYFIKHFKKIHGNPANYIKSQPNQAQAVIAAATPMIEKGAQLAAQAIQRRGVARTAQDIAQTAKGVKAAVGEKAAKNLGKPLKRKNAEKLAKRLEAGGYSVIIGPDGKKWMVQIENPDKIPISACLHCRTWHYGERDDCPDCGSKEVVVRSVTRADYDAGNFKPYFGFQPTEGEVPWHENPTPKGWEVIDSSGRQVGGPFETEQAGWDYVAGHGGPDTLSVEPIEGMYANPEKEDVEEFEAKYYPPPSPREFENPRQFYELTERDVGRPAINAFGYWWPVTGFMGRILRKDIGKRVYLVGDILQVENDEQRARRLGKRNPADPMDVEGMHMARLMLGKQNPEEQAPAQPAAPPPSAPTLAETQARINEVMARMQRGEITEHEGVVAMREIMATGTPATCVAVGEAMIDGAVQDTRRDITRRRTQVIRAPQPTLEEMQRVVEEVRAQTAQITDPAQRQAEMERLIRERGGQAAGQMFQGPHGPYHVAYTQLKPAVVKIVRDFIVKARPWRGTAEEKQQKFEAVIKKLARHYNIRPPTVHISDPEHAMGSGFYNRETNHIELPHYSVVTLLHEFKHAMQHLTNQPQNEEVARGWSLSLFYKAAPKHFKRAVDRAIIFFITPEDITDRPEPMLFAFAESPSPALPILAPLKARLEEMGYRTELRDGQAKLRRDGQPEAAKLLYTNAPGFVVDRALKYHMQVPDGTYRGEVDQALMRIEANPRKAVYVVKCPKCGEVQETAAFFVGGVSQPLVHDCRECDFSLHEEHILSSHYENPRRKGKAFVRGRFEVRPSGRYIREKVEDEGKFDKRSFRTIERGAHKVVIGCPAKMYDPTTKRCRVGTRAQSVLHPLSEAEKYGFEAEELVATGIPIAPPPEVIEVLENPDPYYYSSEAVENPSPEAIGKGAGAAAEVASMAATGAAMGSVVPGVGTAIGAGAGAGAAVAKQAYEALKERKRKKVEAAAAAAPKTTENPEPPQALIDARDLM